MATQYICDWCQSVIEDPPNQGRTIRSHTGVGGRARDTGEYLETFQLCDPCWGSVREAMVETKKRRGSQ